jgi:hypothetical protein
MGVPGHLVLNPDPGLWAKEGGGTETLGTDTLRGIDGQLGRKESGGRTIGAPGQTKGP